MDKHVGWVYHVTDKKGNTHYVTTDDSNNFVTIFAHDGVQTQKYNGKAATLWQWAREFGFKESCNPVYYKVTDGQNEE
jgi:hypothetical protein